MPSLHPRWMVDEPGRDHLSDVALVMTTINSVEAAEQLVRTLLDETLIACGNVVPNVVSIYRWEGSITSEGEVIVLLKTATARVAALRDRLIALHPYSVPEMVTLPVAGVFPPYARWVLESTGVSA